MESVKNYIFKIRSECLDKKMHYSPAFFNCVSFVDGALNAIGYSWPIGRAFTPRQLARRIHPMDKNHAMATQYSLVRSYGIATLGAAYLNASLADDIGAISTLISPVPLDLIVGYMLCRTLLLAGYLSLQAIMATSLIIGGG
jgi:hypothetical protein